MTTKSKTSAVKKAKKSTATVQKTAEVKTETVKTAKTTKKAAPKTKAAAKTAKKEDAAAETTATTTSGAAAKKTPAKKKSAKKASAEKKGILVIVESPAKAKTIEKYLGSSYKVKASFGHLIDLPKSRMAVDIENNFEPEYITVRGRAKVLNELQADAKRAELVMLASDNDREGEAIAWHLQKAIHAKDAATPISRISFNEITPAAIREAVKNPKPIDEAKVDAQKARRVLDRLVGYNLSPLLWKKVKNGLSAGRVQSVALRLICEREKEVESFIPEEYWTLDGEFAQKAGGAGTAATGAAAAAGAKSKKTFSAQLVLWQGEKPSFKNAKEVEEVISKIKDAPFSVRDVKQSEKTIRARPPFTTSVLQQTAANRLGFTSKKTMQLAQQLYEGVNIGRSRVGLITYMRTDSVRISQSALQDVRGWIAGEFPSELPEKPNFFSVSKGSQDAHEAIRPTYTKYTPDEMLKYLSRDQHRLYSIIWERFVSSQMSPAKTRTLSADIAGCGAGGEKEEVVFRVSGTTYIVKGWTKVLKVLASKEDAGASSFPALQKDDTLGAKGFKKEQHWTQGPARYTDASIVKTLEEKGIGRPSTYAPTISLLLERYYVQRANKQLVPTMLGKLISNMLVENFGDIIDADFTALMEGKLDEVEEKHNDWHKMITEFYSPFKEKVESVGANLLSYKGSLDEATDKVCDKCGRPMVKKLGKFGYFLACTGFPECRNAKSIPVGVCPKCGGDLIERRGKGRSRKFYGCANYPKCDFLIHNKPLDQKCPKCGWFLIEKNDKKGHRKVCINPDCDHLRDE